MLGTTAQQHGMTDTKYKHTELGPIPEHWELRQWQYLLQENVTTNTDCKETHQLQFKYGDIVSKANQEVDADTLKIISKYTKVQPNDIMINGLNLNYDFISQRIGMVRTNGIITSAYISLRPTEEANPSYYNYLLKAMDAQKMFHGMGTGVRLTLSYKELKNKYLPFPPLDEQEAMVAYLDEQTGKIDAAIEREQKMIDLLNERKQIIIQQAVTKGLNPNAPLKDSGIEWIGAIPEGWKIMRLKRLVDFAGRIGFRGYGTEDLTDEENGAITLSPSNMQNGKMTYQKCAYLKWNKYYESPEIMVHDGDILFVKTGSTYGKAAIVKALPKEATINPQLLILKNIKGDNRFIAHVLSTPFIKNQVERIVIGGTIPTISQEKIGNLRLIVPDKGEQTKIVEYIEDKTKPIDDAINAKYKLISMLRERKQIIVNEVVTGKIKVS